MATHSTSSRTRVTDNLFAPLHFSHHSSCHRFLPPWSPSRSHQMSSCLLSLGHCFRRAARADGTLPAHGCRHPLQCNRIPAPPAILSAHWHLLSPIFPLSTCTHRQTQVLSRGAPHHTRPCKGAASRARFPLGGFLTSLAFFTKSNSDLLQPTFRFVSPNEPTDSLLGLQGQRRPFRPFS